jgi:probable rRNA maturation factor
MGEAGDQAVEIQFACDDADMPDAAEIRRWATAVLAHVGFDSAFELGVRVVSPDEMRSLNRQYRGRNAPTNVLSFPAGTVAGLPDGAPVALGDIVVCAAVVRDEARQQGKPATDHWAHMIVHGVLHLLGYDHGNDTDAARMEAAEKNILATGGIRDPYRV